MLSRVVAVGASDYRISSSLCPILIITHGLKTVLLKIVFAAEHLKGVKRLCFHHIFNEGLRNLKNVGYPVRMAENAETAARSDVVEYPDA